MAAVLQLQPGSAPDAADIAATVIALVKERIGGVKAPKQVEVWPDLPQSKVGKILKTDVRTRLLASSTNEGSPVTTD